MVVRMNIELEQSVLKDKRRLLQVAKMNNKPNMTSKEFTDKWLFDKKFNKLYDKWKESGVLQNKPTFYQSKKGKWKCTTAEKKKMRKKSRRVFLDGVEYDSVKDAASQTDLSEHTLRMYLSKLGSTAHEIRYV